MNTELKTLVEKIENDTFLSKEDKQGFLLVVDLIPATVLQDINDAAEKDKSFISFLWSNLSKKREAIQNHDNDAIESILNDQISFISTLSN